MDANWQHIVPVGLIESGNIPPHPIIYILLCSSDDCDKYKIRFQTSTPFVIMSFLTFGFPFYGIECNE